MRGRKARPGVGLDQQHGLTGAGPAFGPAIVLGQQVVVENDEPNWQRLVVSCAARDCDDSLFDSVNQSCRLACH
jgi:hypothetical protein